ncbi:MAG: hypothetical protein ACREJN_17820 [Nitrospiraceae bacterium]
MSDTELRCRWSQWIVETFENRPCVFGSLVYPCLPHHTDIPKSVRIYTEQVLRRSSKSHPESLRRVFIAERTPGEEIRKTRVQPIPLNGEIHHLLIKRPRRLEIPVMKGMPDIPHIHFMMEVPNGFEAINFAKLCEERWCCMNMEAMNWNSRLAKVEVVRDLSAVARYITKEYVNTQGENIILTHATLLKESAFSE